MSDDTVKEDDNKIDNAEDKEESIADTEPLEGSEAADGIDTESSIEAAASQAAMVFPPDFDNKINLPDEDNVSTADADIVIKEKNHSGSGRMVKIISAIVGAVIVCTYISISVWFMFHYNYKTYINGADYSFYTLSEVDDMIISYISDYNLTLKVRGGKEYTVTPKDIDLRITPNITAKEIIRKQNGFLWPYYMAVRKDYELFYNAEYDKDKLRNTLSGFAFTKEENMEKPTDAYVTIQEGKSVIISEIEGNYIDFDELCVIIDEALIRGESVLDIDDSDAYMKPEITADSDEIITEQEKLARILDMTITFKIDEVSWDLTSEEYGDWIQIKNGSISFPKDKVHEYVQGIADRYDTYGTERNFRTHDGRTVTLANTWYGWMIDVEGETEELYKLLKAGKSTTHVPLLDCYAAVYKDGGDDIGDTYIECDFGQQHVYVYVNGELTMDSDCVSGSLSNNCRTPEGVYTILYTKSPALLVGDDYETPVKYWMPFIGELGIGFHDATWRGSFGGNIYVSGGSHGCVNLPLDAAEKLFNIAYDGMPVVCYY